MLAGYIQTIKPLSEKGLATEAVIRFKDGVVDIVAGGIDYVGKKGATAYYAARDLSGDRSANDMLRALDEVQQEQKQEADSLAEKFAERGFAGKATVGVASSLPLMASFFIAGPAGTLSTAGKFGRVAASFNKLVKHMPVALATMSMAKSHEDAMVARGVDRATAQALAVPTAIVNMYVEKMALDKVLGISKGKIFKASNSYLTRALSRPEAFIRGAAEGTVEIGRAHV